MTTFPGYELKTSQEEPGPIIWWDGKKIQVTDEETLRELKHSVIPFSNDLKKSAVIRFSDGAEFFKRLPLLYRGGYTWLVKIKVNDKGEKV